MSAQAGKTLTYDASGVATLQVEGGLRGLAGWIHKTFEFNPIKPQLPLGYYANVLPLTAEVGLAISTDSVGTKVLIAELLGKFDTVGIDCVAMNANDVLCVGARPVSMVDFIAVEQAAPGFLEELAKGLHEGARLAGINIPGGEVAQVRELIRGAREGSGFELVGTCVGTVHPQRVLIGQDVRPGDVVVGIASSGVHSNGFTLARRVLFDQAKLKLGESDAPHHRRRLPQPHPCSGPGRLRHRSAARGAADLRRDPEERPGARRGDVPRLQHGRGLLRRRRRKRRRERGRDRQGPR
jgi:phosphoribosylformylglycinamidine cyclo-ligase